MTTMRPVSLFFIFICFAGILFPLFSHGNNPDTNVAEKAYFYHGLKYGSQAVYNPLTLLLNGGYDIYQLENSDRRFLKFPYKTATVNVFKNLAMPHKAIRDVGVYRFFSTEILPLNFTREGLQWLPNYTLHFIGGGLTYSMMTEYYRHHNIPHPKVFSIATTMLTHFLNEIIENNDHDGTNADPIADIYFFNIAGIILFSSERVNRFFHEKLQATDWSLQPSVTFPGGRLHNNGQYFVFRYSLPFYQPLHLFARFGMGGLLGLSYRINKEHSVSAGGGFRSGEFVLVNENGRSVTIKSKWSTGFFWDKNNSLLASLQVSGTEDYFVNANLYPGVIRFGKFSPGLWLVVSKDGNTAFGITSVYTLGVGLGYDSK